MSLVKLADGLWVLQGNPIHFLTFPYEIRCTIIDVGNGELLVHSPVQIALANQLQALPGRVKYIVAPNKLHSLFLDDWQKAYPEAQLYAPPGLKAKRPDVSFYKELADQPEPEWRDAIKQKIVKGSWFMSEVVLFHVPSKSLILGDLIENHNPNKLSWLHRQVAFAMAIVAPNGTTARIFRWSFVQRKKVRRDLQEIMNWNPKRVIVNHGPIVENRAHEFLSNAFQWALSKKKGG